MTALRQKHAHVERALRLNTNFETDLLFSFHDFQQSSKQETATMLDCTYVLLCKLSSFAETS